MCYGCGMTIEQTVEIPTSRRLIIDVPPVVPAGRVVLAFTPEYLRRKAMEEEQSIEFINRHAEDVLIHKPSPSAGVEPFTSEKEAIDFANDCAERLLHEAW